MMNLSEYRARGARLCDYLPWAALVAPGVVLNKDGSFQRTLRFRGPDLESATEAELVSTSARVRPSQRPWLISRSSSRDEGVSPRAVPMMLAVSIVRDRGLQ